MTTLTVILLSIGIILLFIAAYKHDKQNPNKP